MQIRIKGARVLDPGNIDEKKDIIIKNHLIYAIVDPKDNGIKGDDEIIDAREIGRAHV